MSTEADIEQYLRDPLSMPEGMEAIDSLLSPESAKPDSAAVGNDGQPDKAKEEAAPANNEDVEGAASGTSENADTAELPTDDDSQKVVKSKDGKHEIPYTVLQHERENRVRAERMVQELTEKLALEQHAKETGESVKTTKLEDIVDPDLLSSLREESPGVADAMDALIGKINDLEGEQAKAKQPSEEDQREAHVQQQLTVEEAIAETPKLSHVRNTNPAAYNEIAGYDEALRNQPKWQDKPMQERFAAAVRMYEAANGVIELPGAAPAAKAATPDDSAKKVDEAVKKANATASGPNTLSDIPGGGLPATDETAAIEEMSASALTAKMMSMTDEQREEFLARLS